MLHQFRKQPAPISGSEPPSWDPLSELRRLFKQNALLALEDEDAEEKQQTQIKPRPGKASAEA